MRGERAGRSVVDEQGSSAAAALRPAAAQNGQPSARVAADCLCVRPRLRCALTARVGATRRARRRVAATRTSPRTPAERSATRCPAAAAITSCCAGVQGAALRKRRRRPGEGRSEVSSVRRPDQPAARRSSAHTAGSARARCTLAGGDTAPWCGVAARSCLCVLSPARHAAPARAASGAACGAGGAGRRGGDHQQQRDERRGCGQHQQQPGRVRSSGAGVRPCRHLRRGSHARGNLRRHGAPSGSRARATPPLRPPAASGPVAKAPCCALRCRRVVVR